MLARSCCAGQPGFYDRSSSSGLCCGSLLSLLASSTRFLWNTEVCFSSRSRRWQAGGSPQPCVYSFVIFSRACTWYCRHCYCWPDVVICTSPRWCSVRYCIHSRAAHDVHPRNTSRLEQPSRGGVYLTFYSGPCALVPPSRQPPKAASKQQHSQAKRSRPYVPFSPPGLFRLPLPSRFTSRTTIRFP